MIELHEGLSLCGRVSCGEKLGWIIEVTRRTYRVRWIDGEFTTQLRPDLDDEDEIEFAQAAE